MKQVLITGAMSGLGKQMARIAQARWYAVDILDIVEGETDPSELSENMRFIQGDITKAYQDTFRKKYFEI